MDLLGHISTILLAYVKGREKVQRGFKWGKDPVCMRLPLDSPLPFAIFRVLPEKPHCFHSLSAARAIAAHATHLTVYLLHNKGSCIAWMLLLAAQGPTRTGTCVPYISINGVLALKKKVSENSYWIC